MRLHSKASYYMAPVVVLSPYITYTVTPTTTWRTCGSIYGTIRQLCLFSPTGNRKRKTLLLTCPAVRYYMYMSGLYMYNTLDRGVCMLSLSWMLISLSWSWRCLILYLSSNNTLYMMCMDHIHVFHVFAAVFSDLCRPSGTGLSS